MEIWSRGWADIGSLRTASAWLQWISIGLVFVSGFLQVGKFVVDRRERALSSLAQAELLNPAAQPIRTGTVTIDLVVESAENINADYMDRGGYFAFCRGQDALMILAATESRARQTGNGEVAWRGIFNLDVTHQSVGRPVRFLRDAEYAQIGFANLAAKSHIRRGLAVVTINSAVRLEIPIPEQQMVDDKILVQGIAQYLEGLR